MLRNMLLLGTAIGVAVAFPIIYESRKDIIHDALTSAPVEARPEAAATEQFALARLQTSHGQTETLAGRTVRLQSNQRGHFVGEFRFNGVRIEALVDTGATYVAINRSTARRIGILQLSASDFQHEVSTANGRTRAAVVTIDRLEVGRIQLTGIETLVLEDSALDVILIGMNFLNRLKRFGVETGTLILEQ